MVFQTRSPFQACQDCGRSWWVWLFYMAKRGLSSKGWRFHPISGCCFTDETTIYVADRTRSSGCMDNRIRSHLFEEWYVWNCTAFREHRHNTAPRPQWKLALKMLAARKFFRKRSARRYWLESFWLMLTSEIISTNLCLFSHRHPYKQMPLTMENKDSTRPHRSDLCMKCQKLGHKCC
jgi:hypothetical protein